MLKGNKYNKISMKPSLYELTQMTLAMSFWALFFSSMWLSDPNKGPMTYITVSLIGLTFILSLSHQIYDARQMKKREEEFDLMIAEKERINNLKNEPYIETTGRVLQFKRIS